MSTHKSSFHYFRGLVGIIVLILVAVFLSNYLDWVRINPSKFPNLCDYIGSKIIWDWGESYKLSDSRIATKGEVKRTVILKSGVKTAFIYYFRTLEPQIVSSGYVGSNQMSLNFTRKYYSLNYVKDNNYLDVIVRSENKDTLIEAKCSTK